MKFMVLLCLAVVAVATVSANADNTVFADDVQELHEADDKMRELLINRPEGTETAAPDVSIDMITEKKPVHARSVGALSRSRRAATYIEFFKTNGYTHGCNGKVVKITAGCHASLPTKSKCCPMFGHVKMTVCDEGSPYWAQCRKIQGGNAPGTLIGNCGNAYKKGYMIVYCFADGKFSRWLLTVKNYVRCACVKKIG